MEDQSKEIERLRLQVKNLEKLSSLGMLSAGIAHEIQNPLNFVINFSKLSSKLVDDLEDILEEEKDVLPPESWEKLTALHEEFSEIVNDLHGNLKKIEEHGNRATSIIRGILLYSRGKDDEYIPTDIKNLVKEYVWLAYHSMRANYKGFNIAIREHYEEGLPMLKVIEDNGIGMPENIREQIFSAFFTTKPVGEGTGLGLSITRSIIEEKHDGKIEVESKEGEFTRFIFLIPLTK